MSDTAPVPIDLIQDNLQTQVTASDQMLDIIGELAKKAANDSDSSASPAIAAELQKLVDISRDLRRSANGVAETMVTILQDKRDVTDRTVGV
jgi:hypothetical protein